MYELTQCKNRSNEFESIRTGDTISLSETQFFSEWSEQKLTVVNATYSSNKKIDINDSELQNNFREEEISDLYGIIPNEKIEKALRFEKYIKHLKKLKITQGQLKLIEDEIPRISDKLKDKQPPATSTLARAWRKYEKHHGSINSLIDKRCLIQERKRMSQDHRDFIQGIFDKDLMKKEPESTVSMYSTYENTINDFNLIQQQQNKPIENIVSERTFYRIRSTLNKYEVAVAQLGRAEAKRQFHLIKGHLQADHPLEFVEIDHTPLDIFVIDDRLLLPMGRPWLTIIKDRYSGVIIGLYISFQATGTDSIFGALRHSLLPHDKIRKLWPDIKNEMPWGQAMTYVTDRGKDFVGLRYRLAIRQLLSDYEYCAVRNPWLKGSVERAFKTLNDLLETLPGKTFPRLEQRKDYNPLKHAVVRFSSFTYIIYKWACDIYNVSSNKRKGTIPLDLWNEGLINAPRSIPKMPEYLITLFGQEHKSMLRHDGINYLYLTYSDNGRLKEIYDHYGPRLMLSYRINPIDLGYILVLDPRDKTYFRVPCLNQKYAAGLSLIQHNHIKKQAKKETKENNPSKYLYQAKKVISEQIGEELIYRNTNIKKVYARYAGITSDTVLEGKSASVLNIQDALQQPKIITPNKAIITPINTKAEFSNAPDLGWLIV